MFQQTMGGDYESRRWFILQIEGDFWRVFRRRAGADLVIPFKFEGTLIECLRWARKRR